MSPVIKTGKDFLTQGQHMHAKVKKTKRENVATLEFSIDDRLRSKNICNLLQFLPLKISCK